MNRVIEFMILVFCIAAACGIIAWLVKCGGKTNNKKDKNDN
jgi:hypothetical protein